MSEEKVPYIKRLEYQRDALVKALKTIELYHDAVSRSTNTGYPGDAAKAVLETKKVMERAISDAKNLLGGLYA